jgi:tetratricopeptide (TPR) repeat protein
MRADLRADVPATRRTTSRSGSARYLDAAVATGPVTNDSLEATIGAPDQEPSARGGQLEPGARLGRYEIVEPIGKGGMGVVYAAFDPELDRKVAVKLLLGGSGTDSTQGRGRMLREAQAMAKLSHPNVIAVHDVGTVGDRVYIAMELVDGPTLTKWLAQSRRPIAQIVAMFVGAGAGLAGAHAAGLVHRDFKPDNVMIGTDGRPRVMDFGLARRSEDQSTAQSVAIVASSPGAALSQSLTATGAVMGTPAYMAPEQLVGSVPDAKSDQFSFCVALWEAVYGERPFAGKNLHELAAAVLDGKIARPGRSEVSRRVRLALERGLSTRPSDRFATMDDLIARIGSAPPWRRALPVSATAIAVAGVAYGVGLYSGATQTVCDDGSAAIDAAWSAERRATIDTALREADSPYAVHAADGVMPRLDAHAGQWRIARAELCAADAGSAAQIDRRTRCLDQRLRELVALADVLALAEPDTLEHAVTLTDALPPIEQCADDAMLAALAELPTDPTTRERADAIGRGLAEIDTLLGRGRFAAATKSTADLADEVAALDHPPSSAQFEWRRARALGESGDIRGAQAALELGVQHAIAGRDDRMLAQIAIEIVEYAGEAGDDTADIGRWCAVARGAMARLSDPTLARIDLAYAESYARRRAGDAQGALAAADAGLELAEATLPPDHTEVGRMLSARGIALQALGRPGEGLPGLERALAIDRHHFGEVHPRVAAGHGDLAIMVAELGHIDEAAEHFEQSLAIDEAIYGPTNVALAPALTNLAEIRGMQERPADAVALNRRALALREAAYDGDHPEVAINLTNLGHALHNLGQDDEAALVLQRGAEIRERKLGADHPLLALTKLYLAGVLYAKNDRAGSIAAYESALAIWRAKLGERHPNVGAVLVNLGEVRIEDGAIEAGAAQMKLGIEILTEVSGAKHRDVAQAYAQLGEAMTTAGRANEGRAALEHALSIQREVETAPGVLGDSELVLAYALWAQGEHEAARASATAARDHFADAGEVRVKDVAKADAWLRGHAAEHAAQRGR